MPVPMPQVDIASRRNLELKVRVSPDALDVARNWLAGSTTGGPDVQHQEDRYFRVPDGRLKLRTIAHDTGESRAELIAYQRPDVGGSRWSFYRITPLQLEQAGALAETLEQVLPVLVIVRKRREVHLHGATRIHLDDVDGLGVYIELETVITSQTSEDAAAEHQDVIDALGLGLYPVEAGSYSDLLREAVISRPESGDMIDE